MDHRLLISQTHLQKGAAQLGKFCLAFQAVVVLATLFLVAIAINGAYMLGDLGDLTETKEVFVDALKRDIGLLFIHALVQALCALWLLECVRRWAKHLAASQPDGAAMLENMARIKWAAGLLLLVSIVYPHIDYVERQSLSASTFDSQGMAALYSLTWEISLTPVFAAAIVIPFLVISERIASEIQVLRIENSEFI